MQRGGARHGAGRKRGQKSKRTQEREAAVQQAATVIEQALGEAFKGDAHALLMAVYKDMSMPMQTRLDAAKAAIRFEKPSLAATAVVNNGDVETATKASPRDTGKDHLESLSKRYAAELRMIEGGAPAKTNGKGH